MTASSRLFRPKKATVRQTSPTPILDLIEPLPKPADEIITGKFASPFLTFVGLAVVNQNYSFLIVLLGFLPATFLAVAIHECGHLIFGWCAGLSFRGVEIGPLCILLIQGKWSFRLRPRVYAGGAHVRLRRIRRIRHQLALCTVGGPLTSYAFAAFAFIFGELHRPTDNFGWTTFLEFSGFLSLLIAVFSTFPYRTKMGPNDAYILRRLLTSKIGAAQMIASHAASFAGAAGPIPPAYFERWWKLACADSEISCSRYYVGWNTYRAAKDPLVAAAHLEQLLRDSSWHDVETRNFLCAEATFFTGRHNPASGVSSIWLSRTTHLEWLDALSRIRLDVSRAESRRDFARALTACDAGLSLIRASSNGAASCKTECEWLEWKKQIEERATAKESEVLQTC
jgi:hypothetical protein